MNQTRDKKVYGVTGANGFLGRNLLNLIVSRGGVVHAIDLHHPSSQKDEWRDKVVWFDADIRKKETLIEPLKGIHTLFHTAAIFDLKAPSDLIMETNIGGTRNILESALTMGIKKFVHISSTGVYGLPMKIPCSENDEKKPRNPYEKSKKESEEIVVDLCQKNGLPFTVIRPTLIYGEWSRYGHAKFIAVASLLIMKRLREGKPVRGFKGGYLGHHVHVRDVAASALHLSDREESNGGIFNIADLNPLSLGDFLNAIIRGFGIEPESFINLDSIIIRGISRFSYLIPDSLLERGRKKVRVVWEKLIRDGKVLPFIEPELEKGWLDYAKGNFVYDIQRLKNTGYSFSYPDIREGMKEVIQWYTKMRFIPDIHKDPD